MCSRKMIVLPLFQLLLSTLGLFPLNTVAFPRNEVEALNSFKRAIFEDPFLVLSNWNPIDSNPCNWRGVSCSEAGDYVIKLNVSYASLRGFLVPEFHLLSHLQELILHQNYLIGAIPKELCLLKSLQVLDLGSNRLTGSIPQLGNITSIKKILTWKLPVETGNVKNLKNLRLDKNKLLGSIQASESSVFLSKDVRPSKESRMGLCGASQLRVIDLSNNFLVGSIPKCLNYVPRSSFQGIAFKRKIHRSVHLRYAPAKHRSGGSKPRWLLPLEIVTATVVVSIFTIVIVIAIQRWKATRSNLVPWIRASSFHDYSSFSSDLNVKDAVKYSRQELEAACEGFSNIIVSSTDHVVYKGTMESGVEVAVSSVSVKEENWTGYSELYFQKERMPAIYEDARFQLRLNGTLHEHLHDVEGCQLSWPRRMKIVIGIANGLKYLHSEAHPPLTLPHLNSSCVYLTEDFSPKLMIFECWQTILARSSKSSNTLSNTLSHENGNKHAFGVMLLEIISGRAPYCKEKGNIVDWAREYLESNVLTYMVDPELKDFRYEDLKTVCQVIKICCMSSGSKSMSELCDMLESGLSVNMNASLGWAELELQLNS